MKLLIDVIAYLTPLRIKRWIKRNVLKEFMKMVNETPEYWDIITIMRGDDTPVPYLKHIFTARFRYLVGLRKKFRFPMYVREIEVVEEHKLEKMLNSLVDKDIWRLREHIRHYVGHAYNCLHSLRSLNLIDRLEHEFLLTVCDMIVKILDGDITPEDALKKIKKKYSQMVTEYNPLNYV